jgi:hypothetical protein
MKIEAENIDEYLEKIPKERKESFNKLRDTIVKNLPKGFSELLNYGMIGYVVSHTLYPAGYHCDPKLPLPFTSIASQKNFIAFYHMGMYAKPELLDWFVNEYPKNCKYKLDMGKSCVRFKKINDIPYKLIGELMTKMNCEDWISLYEKSIRK